MGHQPVGNRELIRALNRSAVLNTIKTQEEISRAEVARLTGLSPATVSGITAELIQADLIFEKAAGDSRGGRRPILLALNPHGGYVVGIKLADEMLIGAITDLEATVIAKKTSRLADHQIDTVLECIVSLVGQLVAEANIPNEKLLGVGIGLAGFVDALSGKLRYSPIFGWRDVPLVSLLQERLHVPISIDNDVNTLTLTELLFGTGQGISNFFTVTIGRGVGMGVVVNGQLYRGATGWAGEFGHIVIDPDGPACACGKSGCLETYISDPALVRLAREAVAKGNLHASIQTVNDLVAAAERGERAAREILAAAGEKLGVAISNLVNIFNPALIIISGEGVRAGDCLFSPMHAAIELNVVPGFIEDVEIKIDVWDDDAWARGAASLVLLDLFTSPFYPQVMARTTAS